MSNQTQDRHICCPACGTGFSSVDDPYEVRRVEAFSQGAAKAPSPSIAEGLRRAAEVVHNISRGTKSVQRSIAIDEARDLILDEAKFVETFQGCPGSKTALESFVETINATGGVVSYSDGTYGCEADGDWLDLADSYLKACKALGVQPKVRKAEVEANG